ncbi:ribonuclease HII [Aureicoccus marinus]|uniref:ribonuclease HII n=1 Tax=Aureicoccus marinus TaxID=754435 RepID=UPI000CF45931|nr:ribonuclease HII [Aureicoccus marinus]
MLKRYNFPNLVAGIDEAGRGCLAGPVTAAAVILPPDFELEGLNDSKQLSEEQKTRFRAYIEEHALAWSVQHIPEERIDEINILQATFEGMHRCVDALKHKPEILLIDGNRFKPYPFLVHECVIKGDQKYLSIAAASVLAKTHRDEYMQKIHAEFPQYNWAKNKGYPTQEHRKAIALHDKSPHHRKSFKLLTSLST